MESRTKNFKHLRVFCFCGLILTHTRIFQFRLPSCALRAAGLPEMPTAEPPASAALGSGRRSGELLSLLRTGLLVEADFLGSRNLQTKT